MQVILQAVHAVVHRECSPRMCAVLLNILNCLIDLNAIVKREPIKKVRHSYNFYKKYDAIKNKSLLEHHVSSTYL